MNVDSTDSAYITPALPMASCTMVEIDPKQNHGGPYEPQTAWLEFLQGKVSCVIDRERPKKRAIGRNQSLKKKFAVAGSVSEHNWFLLTFPPLF